MKLSAMYINTSFQLTAFGTRGQRGLRVTRHVTAGSRCACAMRTDRFTAVRSAVATVLSNRSATRIIAPVILIIEIHKFIGVTSRYLCGQNIGKPCQIW